MRNNTRRCTTAYQVRFSPVSLGGSVYAAHFMEPTTSKSDVHFLKAKLELLPVTMSYIASVNSRFSSSGYHARCIRCNNTGGNFPTELVDYCRCLGMEIETYPSYAPASNGLVESLVQEHWNRARLLLFATDLPDSLWAEALHH